MEISGGMGGTMKKKRRGSLKATMQNMSSSVTAAMSLDESVRVI